MSLINPMAIANAITPAAASINLRENRDQDLRSDQVIRASVAEGGLEKVLLQMGGKRFWIDTETPLATGQKVALHMVETEQGHELRILQTSLADRIRQVLHLVGHRFELLPLLNELTVKDHPLFKQLSLPSQNALQGALLFFQGQLEGSDGRFLKSLARVLGLDFEHRLARGELEEALASLKGALQETMQRLGDGNEQLGSRIRQLHQMLEACQVFRCKLDQDGLLLLPLPLPFIDYGYLLAERHKQPTVDQQRPGGIISLHLQLSALGSLGIEMLFDLRGLSLRIRSGDHESCVFLESFREEIEKILEPYELANLTFSADAVAPQQNLINLLTRGRDTVLNARV